MKFKSGKISRNKDGEVAFKVAITKMWTKVRPNKQKHSTGVYRGSDNWIDQDTKNS